MPLLVLIEAAKNGNENEVEDYAQVFTEHANKLVEVGNTLYRLTFSHFTWVNATLTCCLLSNNVIKRSNKPHPDAGCKPGLLDVQQRRRCEDCTDGGPPDRDPVSPGDQRGTSPGRQVEVKGGAGEYGCVQGLMGEVRTSSDGGC